MDAISFFGHFLKDYRIGALTKSSAFTVSKVSAALDYTRDITIIEYGPGEGVITRAILAKMTPGSKLIAIETNDAFIKRLSSINDPRLVVAHDKAQRANEILTAHNISCADYVVSGIPFTFFPRRIRKEIVSSTKKILCPGGTFVVYQYTPKMTRTLKRIFGNVRVSFVPLNLPSYFLMESVRAASEQN